MAQLESMGVRASFRFAQAKKVAEMERVDGLVKRALGQRGSPPQDFGPGSIEMRHLREVLKRRAKERRFHRVKRLREEYSTVEAAHNMTGLESNPTIRRQTATHLTRTQEELYNGIRVNVVRGSPSLEGAVQGTDRGCPLCGGERGDAAHWIGACPDRRLGAIRSLLTREAGVDWKSRPVNAHPEAVIALTSVALLLSQEALECRL